MKASSSLTFPAVTVCNLNPIKKSEAAEDPVFNVLLDESNEGTHRVNKRSISKLQKYRERLASKHREKRYLGKY